MLAALVTMCLFAVVPGTADAEPDGPEVQCNGDTRTGMTNFYSRIEYAVTYNQSAQRVCVVAKNTGEENGNFVHLVQIDEKRVKKADRMELTPGEQFRGIQNITGGIDATEENHSVFVSTRNDTFYFNFTEKIDTMNEGGVPTPHFENLTIKRNGTKSGQPRIVMQVENEGIRTYVPEAEVRTFESNSRRLGYAPNGTPGGRFSVRLSEDKNATIVGTVRLYGGTFNPDTKFDRMSFVSYPNGTYETWEPEFDDIPTAREIEEREVYYENETAREKYTGPDVDPISEKASKAGAILVVVSLVGALWYRRRRKFR
jgi:hypothetical protein